MDVGRVDVDGPDRRYGMAYTAFGRADAARTIICVHGLTRNSRDFDVLAQALAGDARVICPDIVGRGRSDWLDDPEHYSLPTYVSHMSQLIAHLGVSRVDWIGTSMGGLIGMVVAAQEGSPVDRLVLNDVGPLVPKAALARIGVYLGLALIFPTLAELEAHLRQIHAPFGPLTDAQWAHLARHSARARPDGQVVLNYDPEIAVPFRTAMPEDVDLWSFWDQIRCPVQVLRGAMSDLLLKETAIEMTRRGPETTLVEFDGVGHAPALLDDIQIRVVRDWLTLRHRTCRRSGGRP